MNSQNATILEHLKRGHTLTRFEAMQKFGIANCTARIAELRQAGEPIEDEWVESTNRFGDPCKFKRYRLSRKRGAS